MGKPVEILPAELAAPSAAQGECAGAATGIEGILAKVLAEIMHVEQVPADSHFFDDLGADSLVMAHFCARVRKRADLPSVSIKDIYRHPTIRSLATALADTAPAPGGPPTPAPAEAEVAKSASTAQYVLCGAVQLLCFLAYCYLAALLIAQGYDWISAGSGVVDVYSRTVMIGVAGFVAVGAVPIVAKWLLIGRWKPQQIPIWSLGYVRFWTVKTLLRFNPCALALVGSPLYVLYLRALGAKVGSGVVIFSRRLPVCTDLLTIGDGAVIRKDALILCYRAHAGRIETGTVTLGRDVFIGERTVLDINTSMGNGAQIGHASSLHSGQAIPDGQRWHGCPAQPTELDYVRVAPARCGTLRRGGFCAVTLASIFFVYLPLVERGLNLALSEAPPLGGVLGATGGAATLPGFISGALVLSLVLFFGAVLGGLLLAVAVPHVLKRFVQPGRVYPLYGFHDRVNRAIWWMTNRRFFQYLFGDSSYIVHYLSWLGYSLSPVEQTGSNFGIAVSQMNPCLTSVGTGTMAADGLSMMNDEVSSTSFCVSRVSLGRRNFVGNDVAYPAGGRTGENCLLATKVMVPLDGEIHEGVGLLGSPCFEIPRSVERDSRFDHLRSGEALRRGLAAKNRYNIRTICIFLVARWLAVFLFTAIDLAAFERGAALAHVVMAALLGASLVASALYFTLVERCVAGFRSLRPAYCSIYDPVFWRYERLWKVTALEYLHIFDGTPFKNVIWKLMGVRVGKRVFDDGVHIAERTLTSIGDDCVLNYRSKIQCHSQEDATFKADRTTIGAGCTVGVGALIHYGVSMGDGSVLAADSFLMKGEEVPARARWGGNPAREI